MPLFDPSGLSASLSADDWHSSFDLNSVAAARLGIGSPTSQNGSGSLSASIANLAHSNSHTRENTDSSSRPLQSSSISRTSSNDIAVQSSLDNDDDAAKRGRRRRSSAVQDTAQTQVHPTVLPQKDTSVGSKVRMWWERSAAGTPDVNSSDASVVERETPTETLPPLRIDASVVAEASPSPSVRSPAADFLSAFSSLNSVVQPATSYDNRSLSYSPPRSGHRSLGASLMHDDIRNGSSASPSFGSLRGLGSAAAQLYETQLTTASAPSPRSDDEGARVGPAGRYLLGKTIGVGGFSTVRQGWDLEAQGPADPTAPLIDGQPKGRRVAIKIVYHGRSHTSQAHGSSPESRHNDLHSHELRIWKSLPTHQHLLPLLHHESVALDTAHSGQHQGANTTAELLIMPYCDQGNLLDFVRSEGGSDSIIFSLDGGVLSSASQERRSASSSWAAPGSARSSTLLSRSSSLRTSMEDPSRRNPGSRTGSGFIKGRNAVPSHALGRVASVSAASQLQTIPAGQEASSVASSPVSAAGSMSSGSRLLRKTASQLSRSEGIPIDAARETMRQLASALKTLHTNCHILHGDLKLENVLGQDQTSWKKRQRISTGGSHIDTHSRQNSGNLVDSVESLAASSVLSKQTLDMSDAVMPCWRIADFGLAQVLDPAHAKAGMAGAPALIRALKEEARISESKGVQSRKKGHKTGRGGSLAYTAPEFLRAHGTPGTSSPTAVEFSEDDGDLQPESPFAADMWALGCILYAMLSGKLPFTDSFEPRLQMKIAKAQWELPPRLRRRAERLTASSSSTLTSQVSPSDRTLSTDRSRSAGPTDANDRFAFSQQRRSVSGMPRGIASFGSMDLSASLPSLLPRERQMTEPATETMSARAAVVHSDQVVGSAPGRADHLESFEINQVAKAKADVEEDPESDEDTDIDPARDGLSWDRAAARQVLRGLLEPDPRRRWTIEKLCSSAWIRQEGLNSNASASPFQTKPSVGNYFANENDRNVPAHTTGNPTSAKGFTAARDTTRAGVDEESPLIQHGRRSSSLARTRPAQALLDSPASASPLVQSPAIWADGGDSSTRRSRSTSRISIQYRDSSRNRSADASGTSTPNREREQAWTQHHLASSLQSQAHAWLHTTAKERSDSPADSERRGRIPRSRMADLDENTTWNGEEGASSDSRSGSQEANSLRRAGPIAIRGRSQSRSRSRHSRESASPDRFGQRSTSRSRSTYSLPRDAGASTGILYGRSAEPQPTVGNVLADETQVRRSSTARSRSRAPDALAQILDRQRSRSRSRMRDGGDGARVDGNLSRSAYASGTANDSIIVSAAAEDGEVSTRDQEARGRSRDRR